MRDEQSQHILTSARMKTTTMASVWNTATNHPRRSVLRASVHYDVASSACSNNAQWTRTADNCKCSQATNSAEFRNSNFGNIVRRKCRSLAITKYLNA